MTNQVRLHSEELRSADVSVEVLSTVAHRVWSGVGGCRYVIHPVWMGRS